MNKCTSHRRVCGDELIAREIPGFFETHSHAAPREELQVCTFCGDVKSVPAFNYASDFEHQRLTPARAEAMELPPQIAKEVAMRGS